jgi:Beta-ketoacyl synthase, N-terminal domain
VRRVEEYPAAPWPPVIAAAELAVDDPGDSAVNRPSFYADPVAWLTAAAVARALDGHAHELGTEPDVGIVVMSATCTAPTMAVIARTVGRSRVSPLKFAGANPGILAGLPCIRGQFHGPSLVLATDPAASVDTALCVAVRWLRTRQARYVVCVAHTAPAGRHLARCAVLDGSGGFSREEDTAHVRRLLTGTAEPAERTR